MKTFILVALIVASAVAGDYNIDYSSVDTNSDVRTFAPADLNAFMSRNNNNAAQAAANI